MLRYNYVFSSPDDKQFYILLYAIKAYIQIEINEADQETTTFIRSRGPYKCHHLPFGLKNTSVIYQRLMDQNLRRLRWTTALSYIDDLIIFPDSWAEHMTYLCTLLTTVQASGLQFSQQKYKFAYQNLTMLGLGVSPYGISTWADGTRSVLNVKKPQTMRELHRLVGIFA